MFGSGESFQFYMFFPFLDNAYFNRSTALPFSKKNFVNNECFTKKETSERRVEPQCISFRCVSL